MSFPVKIDRAILKVGDGATPTEVFAIACGLKNLSVNATAQTNDQFDRDCALPFSVAVRTVTTTGKQTDITSSGIVDKSHVAIFLNAVGVRKNYRVECYQDNGTDAGLLMGTFAGNFVMGSSNLSFGDDGGAVEVALASNGVVTWTPTV